MKTLQLRLHAAGITSSLEPWYEAGDERGFRLSVPGADAEETWDILHDLVEKTRFWPVILGEREDMERVAEEATEKTWGSTNVLIERSLTVSGEEYFQGAFEQLLSDRQEDLEYTRESGDEKEARELEAALAGDSPFRCMPRGAWPRGIRPSHSIATPYHYSTGEPWPEVFIGLVPTTVSWQVPIYLNFGGFNDCPHPDCQGPALRYWEEKYGATLICMRSDVLELTVERPPTTRKAALELAREQFLHCRDIVEQGTETLERLAAELLNDTTWFFWWD
jgi:hypothetical protein